MYWVYPFGVHPLLFSLKFTKMKSKIEIRQFAIEKAVSIMGVGTSDKDVITKAKEIESYIIGDAELPEVYDETNTVNTLINNLLTAIK